MLNWYKKQKADILLSVMSPVIFKKQLLNCAKLAINIHPSLLPSFKGIDPIFWAIKSNEKVFGVTIHQMVEKVDEGKTFIQQEIPLQNGISVHQGNYKAAVLGGKMLVGLLSLGLNKIKRLRYHAKKQYKPSFYSTPKTADFRQLINSGKKLVIIKDCFPFFETY
jgi:methionyl-tRNA formyltransferase